MLFVQVLGNMKHCILATDLALFFPNKARLANIVKENSFSWDIPDHRLTYTLYTVYQDLGKIFVGLLCTRIQFVCMEDS
jgi:hypothetical protein